MTESEELPGSVLAAYQRAASAGFQLSREMEVGRLLAAPAAAVPRGGVSSGVIVAIKRRS